MLGPAYAGCFNGALRKTIRETLPLFSADFRGNSHCHLMQACHSKLRSH
jgi:hypothetical protein